MENNLNRIDATSSSTNAPSTPLGRIINNNNKESNPIIIGENNDAAINWNHNLLQTNKSTSTVPHPLDTGNSNDIPFRPTIATASKQHRFAFQGVLKCSPLNVDTLGLR